MSTNPILSALGVDADAPASDQGAINDIAVARNGLYRKTSATTWTLIASFGGSPVGLARWDIPGTYSYTIPRTGRYELILGGGGGSGRLLGPGGTFGTTELRNGGGSGALVYRTVSLNAADIITVVVGPGGSGNDSQGVSSKMYPPTYNPRWGGDGWTWMWAQGGSSDGGGVMSGPGEALGGVIVPNTNVPTTNAGAASVSVTRPWAGGTVSLTSGTGGTGSPVFIGGPGQAVIAFVGD